MLNKIIDEYLKWHTKQNKLVRCILKALGFLIALFTSPIWLAIFFTVYMVINLIITTIEFFESA